MLIQSNSGCHFQAATVSLGSGFVMSGGFGVAEYSDVFRFEAADESWTQMEQRLDVARGDHDMILVPDEVANCVSFH